LGNLKNCFVFEFWRSVFEFLPTTRQLCARESFAKRPVKENFPESDRVTFRELIDRATEKCAQFLKKESGQLDTENQF